VKGVETSVCIRFVNYSNGVILSQSTGAWKIFGYEVNCQHVGSIVGPSLLERCLVNENCLSAAWQVFGYEVSGAWSMRIAFREIRLARI